MLYLLLLLLVSSAAIALLITYLHARVRLYPQSPPVLPQSADSAFQRVSFTTEDGLEISAWFAPPPPAGQAVLLLHGLHGNRDQLLPHADYMLEAGYGALLIDFRYHGESEGRVSSMGFHEIKDARAAYAFLRARRDVKSVAIWGHSMGGAVACKLMSEVNAAGLFADAAFSDFAALTRARGARLGFPAALSEFLFIRVFGALSDSDPAALRPVDDLAKVERPVLLLHGSDDEAIPLSQAQRLAAASAQAELSVFQGGGHSDLYELDPVRYRREVLAFLRKAFTTSADS